MRSFIGGTLVSQTTSLLLPLLLIHPVGADDTDDDSFDVQTSLGYLPSKVVGIIGFAVYCLIGIGLLLRLVLNRDWWGLCLPIAALTESGGFLLRVFISQPKLRANLGYYIGMDLSIILSPAAFLAFNYILFGRLVRFCVGRGHSFIRPEILGRTFVISDIVTFLVQATGGSMQAKAGLYIFLGGVALQATSYTIYLCIVEYSRRSILRAASFSGRDPRGEAWYKVYKLLAFSSVFIMIRSIYRVVEAAQGFEGYLITHEWALLVFDSIPLAIGISIYIVYWPGCYIPKGESKQQSAQQFGMLILPSSPQSSEAVGLSKVPE